jgi:hypothetical protein
LVINSVTPLTIPRRGIIDDLPGQPARSHRYSSLALAAQPAVQIRVTACFSKDPVLLRDQP